MIKSNDYKVLIVDDSEMNRMILADILNDKFQILEAADGIEALQMIKRYDNEISIILLDLVMPNMDGFEVLNAMNQGHWIDDIPVIMISSETSDSYIEKAYDLGVTDFISRPFNVAVVQKRVANTIMLYDKQRNLVKLVTEQVYEREKNNNILINILSHVFEFRNGESFLHLLRINIITDIIIKHLVKKTDKYTISREEMTTIVTASSLHDVGKITIPDEILNKPGRLTPEEFEIIKNHSQEGAKMLDSMTEYLNEPLVVTARDICLYHHERYDGKGYPTGISGDDIPISAQIVSIADVYDALTSERCYKPPFSHEMALEMIKNGECGCINPILVECLFEVGDKLKNELTPESVSMRSTREIRNIAEEILNDNKFSPAKKSINLFEQSRIKYEFFASMSQEIQFEYTMQPSMLTLSEWSAQRFNIPTIILNPLKNKKITNDILNKDTVQLFTDSIMKTDYENPTASFDIQLNVNGELRWHKAYCRVTWSTDEKPEFINCIGKIVDVDDDYRMRDYLEMKASIDTLTNLHNRGYSKELICNLLSKNQEKKYALVLLDLDDFKSANDNYGHMFGDKVLKTVASTLLNVTRRNDIVSRIGGDEFLLFIEYSNKDLLLKIANRIFNALNNTECNDYIVKISMGIAVTEDVGYQFDNLFNCADSALYHSKRNGKGAINFYDSTMTLMSGDITPIEN